MSAFRKSFVSNNTSTWLWLLCVVCIVFSSILVVSISKQTDHIVALKSEQQSTSNELFSVKMRLTNVEILTDAFKHYGVFTKQPQTNDSLTSPKSK